MEVAHYLVRNFPRKVARRKIDYFGNLRNMKIADFTRKMVADSLEKLVEHAFTDGLVGRDATIIVTLKSLHLNKNTLPRQYLQAPGNKAHIRGHRSDTYKP